MTGDKRKKVDGHVGLDRRMRDSRVAGPNIDGSSVDRSVRRQGGGRGGGGG